MKCCTGARMSATGAGFPASINSASGMTRPFVTDAAPRRVAAASTRLRAPISSAAPQGFRSGATGVSLREQFEMEIGYPALAMVLEDDPHPRLLQQDFRGSLDIGQVDAGDMVQDGRIGPVQRDISQNEGGVGQVGEFRAD